MDYTLDDQLEAINGLIKSSLDGPTYDAMWLKDLFDIQKTLVETMVIKLHVDGAKQGCGGGGCAH